MQNTQITQQVIKKSQVDDLLKALEDGNNITDACILARISREIYYKWHKSDKEFRDKVELAGATCKNSMIEIVKSAAKKTWQAAAWWLERKHKGEYALRHELTGADNKPLEITVIRASKGKNKDNSK